MFVSCNPKAGREAYNEHNNYNIPATVHHVHLPANISETDWHDEHEETPVRVSTQPETRSQ